jgi:hypothetical protein
MRKILFLSMIVASLAAGQAQRVIYLKNIDAPVAIQELINAIRVTGEIRDVTVDPVKKALIVEGTTEQIAVAEWLCSEFDVAKKPQKFKSSFYPGTTGTRRLADVFYLTQIETPRDLQEIVNGVRSIVRIQRFFPYSTMKAIVASGTADQHALAEWLLTELDSPPVNGSSPVMHNHAVDLEPRLGNQAQVLFLAHPHTPQEIQEVVNATRSTVALQLMFPQMWRKAILMRGSAEQIESADWLLTELDRHPATPATPGMIRRPEGATRAGNPTGLYYLAHASGGPEITRAIRIMQSIFSPAARTRKAGERRGILMAAPVS